jgi:NADH:ubiquinone oxidoreductase subunit E
VTTGGEAREARRGGRGLHDAAMAPWAEVLHAPKEWLEYHAGHYGAFARDPDGNNVEAVCATTEESTCRPGNPVVLSH